MKKILLIFAAIILLCSLNSANAYTNVDFSIGFHDTLSPYGSWVHVASYGNVWRPRVAAGWRPFTAGHWSYTNSGPYWNGEEPYAWCVYHYGHWVFDPNYGWCWVPGYEYSAAPVSWAYGDDYIGWSPIVGYNGYDTNFWVFLSGSRFGYRNYSGYFMPSYRIRPLLQRRAIRIVSRPLQIREVERITRRPVRIQRVTERVVTVDGRRTRLIVPRDRERTVINRIGEAHSRSRHERVASNRVVTKKEVRHSSRPVVKSTKNRHETVHRTVASTHGALDRTKSSAKRVYAHTKSAAHRTYAKTREQVHRTYAKAEHKIEDKNTGGAGGKGYTHTIKSKHTTHHVTKAKAKTKAKRPNHGH